MNDEEALAYIRTRRGWDRFNNQHFTRVYVEAYRDGKEGFNGAECVEIDAARKAGERADTIARLAERTRLQLQDCS